MNHKLKGILLQIPFYLVLTLPPSIFVWGISGEISGLSGWALFYFLFKIFSILIAVVGAMFAVVRFIVWMRDEGVKTFKGKPKRKPRTIPLWTKYKE